MTVEYAINNLPAELVIGRQTETGVFDVRIDCAPWLAIWPELVLIIWVTPPGGGAQYPANTHMEGDVLVWDVNLADTAVKGQGTMEIMGLAEGLKKLSAITTTKVLYTTTVATEEIPDAAQGWVDQVLSETANNMNGAKNAATTAAARATSAAQSASAAAQSASAATKAASTAAADVLSTVHGDISKRDRAVSLLDNGNFKAPENIRGKSSYTGAANTYTIDRWLASTSSVAISIYASGINIDNRANASANGHMNQRLAGVPDGTYTLGASTSAGMVLRTFALSGGVVTYLSNVNAGVAFTGVGFNSTTGFLTVQIGVQAGSVVTVYWAVLYAGEYTVETLPPPMWAGPAATRLECGRHAVSLGGGYRYRAVHILSSAIDFCIPLPVQMRAVPSFDPSALTLSSLSNGALTEQEGFTFSVLQNTPSGLVIRATKASHGLTDAMLHIAANTIFSSDL